MGETTVLGEVKWWRVEDSVFPPSHMLPLPAETFTDEGSAKRAWDVWMDTARRTSDYPVCHVPGQRYPTPEIFAFRLAVVSDGSEGARLVGSINGNACGLQPVLEDHDDKNLFWLISKHIFPERFSVPEAMQPGIAEMVAAART